MTQSPARQQISALLDAEVDRDQIGATLSALGEDSELRASWGRYHLIRGALRGERVLTDYQGVAERVSECLQGEGMTAGEQSQPRRADSRPRRASDRAGAQEVTRARTTR